MKECQPMKPINIKRIVPCPKCRRPAEHSPENPFRPFCSHRCKNEDIADWAQEKYRVPGTDSGSTADDGDKEED